MRDIYANDVVTQNLRDTVLEIASWNVKQGSGDVKINAWALKRLCQEIEYNWDILDDKDM